MAKVIPVAAVHRCGLYDSVTGKSCVTEKVVDMTDDCRGASAMERCLVLFTRDHRGRIAQLVRSYEGEECEGVKIHFYLGKLDAEMRATSLNDTFGVWARELGLEKSALRSLIEAHAPVA